MSEGTKEYIRGVNVGGWLMAERFIVPYLFAVNSCHLDGSLCIYPGQIGLDNADDGKSPEYCDPKLCKPALMVGAKKAVDYNIKAGFPGSEIGVNGEGMDYPFDEYTLGQVLRTASGGIDTATRYMERHWDSFLTYEDLATLKKNGVTHLRIPMGYWIRGKEGLSILPDEPFIPGGWKYFVRAANWCREIGLTIWADLHGAPGSENGFDNSGTFLGASTCGGWSSSPDNVKRTLAILTDMAEGIVEDGIDDVVTGFGLLNEPMRDCNMWVLKQYYEDGLAAVRNIMGESTSVFVDDTFDAAVFNDGYFWLDPEKYHDTYLDTHPYHVFFEKGRSLSPRQHIAYVCKHDFRGTVDCCYEDSWGMQVPSKGISRITGEWSVAFDTLPTALVPVLMNGIANNGVVPLLNRTVSPERQAFMRNFAEAQMVAYEAADVGVSSGWLFWNFKMEGGAFIEWDFLRGLREGWMPPIPEPHIPSESLYGKCYDIIFRTDDSYSIVDEFPDPQLLDPYQYQGWPIDDDLVMNISGDMKYNKGVLSLAVAAPVWILYKWWQSCKNRARGGYTELKV